MSEENVEMPDEEPTESEAPGPKVANELQELGQHLTAATRAVLDSPEAQELGAQLQRGLESLQKAVNQLVTQARETKVGQKVESGVSEATTTIKDRGVLDTMAESVATALHAVNRSLGQAVEKVQSRAEEAKAKKPAPQQIKVVETEEEASAESKAGKE